MNLSPYRFVPTDPLNEHKTQIEREDWERFRKDLRRQKLIGWTRYAITTLIALSALIISIVK